MKTTPPKSPLLITAIQLGLLLIVIYYTLIGGQTAQVIFDHHWRSISQWLTAGLIGGWLAWRFFSRIKPPRTPVDRPLLGLLAAWLGATFFSINSGYSREALVFFASYLFFFYLAADVGRWPWLVELAFNAIIAVAGLVWMLALLQLSWWYQDLSAVGLPLTNPPRLSVLGNPNTMASFIALVFPLVLYKLVTAHYRLTRLLLAGWLLMLAGAIILTQSRGGVLGLVVAVALFGLAHLGQPALAKWAGRSPPDGQGQGKRRWLGVAALAGGSLLLLLSLPFVLRSLDQAVSDRQQVMAGALKAWLAHPLFGVGPGALGQALLRYQQPLDTLWSDAHNLPLTLIAETGLAGGLALLWLALAALPLVRSLFRSEPAGRNRAGLACLAALLGFLAHNMVDSLFKFPLIMLLVASLAGFGVGPTLTGPKAKGWPGPVILLAALGLILTTGLGQWDGRHLQAYDQAVAVANQGDWPAALAALRQAESLAQAQPFYQRQLGLVAGVLSVAQPAYRPQAIAYYERALRQVDQLPVDQANLACLYWQNDQPAAAIAAMRRAARLAPAEPRYALNLAYYLENSGDLPAAHRLYAQVVADRPAVLQAAFWATSESRARLAQLEPPLANSPARAELAFYQGDFAQALALYEALLAQPGVDFLTIHLGRAKTLAALNRPEAAQAELHAIIAQQPWSAPAYLELSRIALAQNKLAEAVITGRQARLIEENGETLFQAGRVAAAGGDDKTALAYYEAAFERAVSPFDPALARYETEVARRRPLPLSYLPCLIQLYPANLLRDITQAQVELLARTGRSEQSQRLYDRLAEYVPSQ
jgi:O-antigen ligase